MEGWHSSSKIFFIHTFSMTLFKILFWLKCFLFPSQCCMFAGPYLWTTQGKIPCICYITWINYVFSYTDGEWIVKWTEMYIVILLCVFLGAPPLSSSWLTEREKSQHFCVRWALCKHNTPPSCDFTCGGLGDSHQSIVIVILIPIF